MTSDEGGKSTLVAERNVVTRPGEHLVIDSKALADLDEAVRRDPESAGALSGRGLVWRSSGNGERLDPGNGYAPIWRDMAMVRSGPEQQTRDLLQQALQGFEEGKWPRPVMEFLSGRSDSAALLAASTDPDANTQIDHLCEANFDLGEKLLLSGRQGEARVPLKHAATDCPITFVESGAAALELKNLSN